MRKRKRAVVGIAIMLASAVTVLAAHHTPGVADTPAAAHPVDAVAVGDAQTGYVESEEVSQGSVQPEEAEVAQEEPEVPQEDPEVVHRGSEVDQEEPDSIPGPLFKIPTASHEVVLTFDDGPSDQLDAILRILEKEDVPAVFFWLGADNRLGLAQDVLKQGHQLGSHTMTHAQLTRLTGQGQRQEMARSAKALGAAAQQSVSFFRPPYGSYNQETLKIAKELGLRAVCWNVDSRDWALANNPNQIVDNVMSEVEDGSIILLHERSQTVKILPELIRSLRAAGYSFRLLPSV